MSGTDEVSGKKGKPVSGQKGKLLSASQLGASAENFDLFCHPCDEDHKRIEVCGFCVECQDYLCGDCVQYHRKLKVTRNHIILDKHVMPKDVKQGNPPVQQPQDICTEPCTKHHGKVLEYYCEAHKEFVCSVCVTLGHITCGVGYIPELAKGIVNSDEYKQLLEKVTYLQKQYQTTQKNTSKSIAEVESESKAYTDKVTEFGEDLIKHIKNLMQIAIDEKDKFVQKMLAELKSSKEKCEKTTEEINSMEIELESKTNSDIESFVAMKKLVPDIKEIIQALNNRRIDSKPTVCQFIENSDLKCIQEIRTFGTLIKYKRINEQLDDINISTEDNKKTPMITGIEVLSDGRLAIVDEKNQSVKLVDTKDNSVTETQLQHNPRDITEVSKGQLAVTLSYEQKIQFLKVIDRRLQIQHLINTQGMCLGIAACQNKLIVGMCGLSSEVQILDMSGRVLRKITNGDNGEKLFRTPWYIVVNPSNDLIYVSDYEMNTLTCVVMTGKVKFVNSDKDMNKAWGLAQDEDGSVFVGGSGGICHVTGEGRKIQTLLETGEEGASSLSIAYDKNTRNIFLGSIRNNLKTYHLQ